MIKNKLFSIGLLLKQLLRSGKQKVGGFSGFKKAVGEKGGVAVVASPASGSERQQPPKPGRGQEKTRSPWAIDRFPVPVVEGRSRFHDYAIPLRVMRAIAEQKFLYCTPIQEKSLVDVLDGKDLVGKANTGTGKTAVFLIAILSRLLAERKKHGRKNGVQALVLAPTRELVVQIAKDGVGLARYCGLSVAAVYGGVDYQKQLNMLKHRKVSVVVATPGRLLDFITKGVVDLRECKILVLDEADRMLDMGFIPDVRRIVGRLPKGRARQTMLFSATVTVEVSRLASQWCKEPKFVEAEPEQVAVDTVEQTVYLTTTEEKYTVLYNLIRLHSKERIIVFANMKNEAKRLANKLQRNGIDCVLLSGDVDQNKRMTRLERFRAGKVKVLVATDVAGRGIHIEGITFVVNYTLPYEPEDYIHRIGRTGRAGASGKSVSFACEEGSFYLPAIEELIGKKFDCVVPEESLLVEPPRRVAGDKSRYHKGSGTRRKKKNYSSRRRKRPGPTSKKDADC